MTFFISWVIFAWETRYGSALIADGLNARRSSRCPEITTSRLRKSKEEFSWLDNLAEVSIHGRSIVLCHYALRVWNRSNRGSWHLYGHSHGRLPEAPDSLSMDVGVDTHNFRPWHYDEIADIMMKKTAVRERGAVLNIVATAWDSRATLSRAVQLNRNR
jgi:hypothetical protein